MKLSLRAKLLAITATLLIAAVVSYLALATKLFNDDKRAYIFEGSGTLVSTLAAETEANFLNIIKTLRLIGIAANDRGQASEAVKKLFNEEDNIVELIIFDGAGSRETLLSAPTRKQHLIRYNYFKPYKLGKNYLENVRRKHPTPFRTVIRRQIFFQNSSTVNGIPMMSVAIANSSQRDGIIDQIIFAQLRQDRRVQLFQRSQTFTTYLLDSYGNILVHPNNAKVMRRESLAGSRIFRDISKSNIVTSVKEINDQNNEPVIMGYSKLNLGGLIVVSEIPKSTAYIASQRLIEKSIFFALLIIAVSFTVSLLFSRRLTASLRRLYHGSRRIAQGDFNVNVLVNSNDEVGALATSFNQMAGEISRLMEATADKARMEKELETAQLVQDNFFPIDHLQDRDFELASFYVPASECGGDWWGHMKIDNNLIILIGDATGHGVPSALITAAAQSCCTTLQSIKDEFPAIEFSPALILDKLNTAIFNAGRGHVKMTFFVSVIDTDTGAVTYANASHDFPMLCKNPKNPEPEAKRSKKDVEICKGQPGQILGTELGSVYKEFTTHLQPGETLCLYTDGIVECRNPQEQMYGKGKFLRSFFKNAHLPVVEMRDILIAEAMNFYGPRERDDDVTMVLIKRNLHAGAQQIAS